MKSCAWCGGEIVRRKKEARWQFEQRRQMVAKKFAPGHWFKTAEGRATISAANSRSA